MAQEIVGSAMLVLLVVGYFWWPTIKSIFVSQFSVDKSEHQDRWAVKARQGFGIFGLGLIPLVASIAFLNCLESAPTAAGAAAIGATIVLCVLLMVFGVVRMIVATMP